MAATLAALFVSAQTIATPIFFDDFESASLNQWLTPGSGQIVPDSLVPANNVLSFQGLGSGGDMFTAMDLAGGNYFLSLDILGTCSTGLCGGFAGIDDQSGEQWLIGDGSWGGPVALNIANNGAWQHVEVSFTANGPFRLKLEDFTWSSIAGDMYLDNICVSDQANDGECSSVSVPEPANLALLILGLAGLGFSRRKKL